MAARSASNYQRSRRLIGVVVLVALVATAGVVGYRLRPVSHTSMPLAGVVMVTGYGEVSASGQSLQPTTVVLTKTQAQSVARTIAELPSLGNGSTFFCHEESVDFLVRVMHARGGRPYWIARDELCPSPGYLLTRGMGSSQALGSVCVLRQLVVSLLPRASAAATRADLRLCPPATR